MGERNGVFWRELEQNRQFEQPPAFRRYELNHHPRQTGLEREIVNYYAGTHTCDLDTKGRAIVPSSFRKVPDEIRWGEVILSPSMEQKGCIEVYPKPEWETFVERVASAENMGIGESRELLAEMFGDADRTKIDKQHRLVLSHALRDVLGVDGADENVTLAFVGAGSYFKIYVSAEYEKQVEARRQRKQELMKKFMAGPNRPSSGNGHGEG
jgi:transcriptional regulator MraZ